MNSLSELNNFSQTSLDLTDNRGSRVVFNRVIPLQPLDTVAPITTTSVPVSSNGNEIVEIINYSTANVRFRARIVTGTVTPLVGSTVSFPTLPAGLSLAVSGTTYTISGITTVAQWDQIKSFTWLLPANYETYPLWYLDVAILYYDSDRNEEMVIDWEVYDSRFYYIANLYSEATVTATILHITQLMSYMTSTTTLSCLEGKITQASANLTSSVSVTAVGSVNSTNLESKFTVLAKANYKTTSKNNTLTSSSTLTASFPDTAISFKVYTDTTRKYLQLNGTIANSSLRDMTVNWGDGTSDIIQGLTASTRSWIVDHTYTTTGFKTVTITFETPFQVHRDFYFGNYRVDMAYVHAFYSWGPNTYTDLSYLFKDQINLTSIPDSLPSTVTNCEGMFENCQSLNSIKLPVWNTSNVTNMKRMFYIPTSGSIPGIGSLNKNLNSWDVSKVTTMDSMFFNQPVFNGNIGSWNVGNVTNMYAMFQAKSTGSVFNQNISNWNTAKVTDMRYMFYYASSFDQDLSGWDVHLIPSQPTGFAIGGLNPNWNPATEYPIWGTTGS